MKKHIGIFLLALGVSMPCLSQIWVDPVCNNYSNSSLTQTFFDPTLLLSPCNSYTTHISGTANVQILSKNKISLQPGFTAGSFSGSGACKAMITPSPQNNYYCGFVTPSSINPITNLPTIGQFQKLEMGISLPASVQQDIDDFLNGSRGGSALNPYAQDSILVQAVFAGPSGDYPRYGFYYEGANYAGTPPDSMSCMISYPGYYTNPVTSIAYQSHRDNAWPFRIRFAPPTVGAWTVAVDVYLPKVQSSPVASFSGSFYVVSSANTGYIVKGNNWHLKYVNGGTFFPIGENMFPYNSLGPDPYPCCIPLDNPTQAGYEWGRGDPPSFVQVRASIADLAGNHGNYVRLRGSDEWGYQIDWDDKGDGLEAPGNYENRQYAAWELDKTIGVCENTNVKLQLGLFNEQFFSTTFFSGTAQFFSWANGGNPYFNLLHKLYPSYTPDELLYTFLSDPTCLYYVERYLFYMNARWGYSASIATWEIWNEADQLGYNGSNLMYSNGSGSISATDFQAQLATWQDEVILYLKNATGIPTMPTFYPVHLITSGYAAIPSGYDNAWANYDIFQTHDYVVDLTNPENRRRATTVQNFTYTYYMPFIFGELGSQYDPCQDISFHDASWAMGVITSGAGLYWSDWYQSGGINHRANFNSLSTFFSQFDFESNIFFQFPIYYWDDNDHLEYYYIVDNDAVLRTSDDYQLPKNSTPNTYNISTEIGWVHNLTNNYENSGYSYTCAGSCDSVPAVAEGISASNLSSANVEFYGLEAFSDYIFHSLTLMPPASAPRMMKRLPGWGMFHSPLVLGHMQATPMRLIMAII